MDRLNDDNVALPTAERGQAEKSARELARYNSSLFEANLDALVAVDLDGKITAVNGAMEEMTGLPRGEITGTSVLAYFPEPEKAARGLRTVLTEGSVRDCTLEVRHRDGSLTPVLYNGVALRDEDGEVVGALGSARDVTEHKRRAEELARALASQREANQRLKRANEMQADFVSVVNHEFRTALTGIQGFSQMMRDEEFSAEEIKELSGDINDDAKRLNRMITEMVDLVRMESGRVTLDLQTLDLNEIIAEVAELTRPNAPEHLMHLQLDRDMPPFSGDRKWLTQLVTNLMSNALKYSPKGGPITVTSRAEDGAAHVSVEDRGAGIAHEALDRLFEPYSKAEAGTTRYVQGTGLGLAISREIVRLHGGDIRVQSTPGEGSTFHFTIPFGRRRSVAR